jgi:competence protein ComEA
MGFGQSLRLRITDWLRALLLEAQYKRGALLRGGLRLALVACVLAVLAWFGGRARVGDARAGPATTAVMHQAPATPAEASLDAGPGSPLSVPVPEVLASPLPPRARGSPSEAMRGEASPEHPVYLNDATEQDLRRLPGIGAKRATAILALRAKIGRFRKVEELMRVRGIGRKGVERLRPVVRLDPPTAADAGAPP